jgi:hypothetical protein
MGEYDDEQLALGYPPVLEKLIKYSWGLFLGQIFPEKLPTCNYTNHATWM